MQILKGSRSVNCVSALALATALAPTAWAQTAPQGEAVASAEQASDIIVTGVRASLDTAQQMKRNSDQIVDSIQAQDIGKLPDANTVESLQRIAGIQIQRRYGEAAPTSITAPSLPLPSAA